MAAVTGRTTWPRTLRIPAQLRRKLCADLGWSCLWHIAKVSAITLFEKCRQDHPAFAHAQLCNDPACAPGGWIASARRLVTQLRLPPWLPDPNCSANARKRSLHRHRIDLVTPAVFATSPPHATPSLPWAWIALQAGVAFSQNAFTLWWQIRVLGQPYPARSCPWCEPAAPLTATHMHFSCATFAMRCWAAGILPAEAFGYPADEERFTAVLRTLEQSVSD